MECYICENEMEYIEALIVSQLGSVKHYKCNVCGEEVYEPIRDRDDCKMDKEILGYCKELKHKIK